MRPKLAEVPGIRAVPVNPPPINLGGGGSRPIYQFTLQDADTTELYRWAPVLEARVREIPGLLDVNSDLKLDTPQVSVEMDRDKLSIWFNGIRVAHKGARDPDYDEAAVSEAMKKPQISLKVALSLGKGRDRVLTCDLTKEYVAINGDYRS